MVTTREFPVQMLLEQIAIELRKELYGLLFREPKRVITGYRLNVSRSDRCFKIKILYFVCSLFIIFVIVLGCEIIIVTS